MASNPETVNPKSQEEGKEKKPESTIIVNTEEKDLLKEQDTDSVSQLRWTKSQTIVAIVGVLIAAATLYVGYLTLVSQKTVNPPKSSPPNKEKGGGGIVATLTILSDPSGADVYLNWSHQGITPLSIKGKAGNGLLVVMKEGFVPQSKEIDLDQVGEIPFTLQTETHIKPGKVLLLLPDERQNKENFDLLRSHLLKEGLSVAGVQESDIFKKEMQRAGGLSNKAFRAWTRARFGVDILAKADVYLHTKDLGKQAYGYEGIQESLQGTYRTEAKIEVETIDLRTGDHTASFSATAAAFANDESRSAHEALGKAATRTARLARQKISG